MLDTRLKKSGVTFNNGVTKILICFQIWCHLNLGWCHQKGTLIVHQYPQDVWLKKKLQQVKLCEKTKNETAEAHISLIMSYACTVLP